jgi:hypothetical protein
MDDLINQLGLNFEESFSVVNYVVNIVICSILLFILSFIYVRYGKSISNRSQLARVLIVVGLTTFIIISIVKSSLALSLGLVGALSIVRFRTAIKEPEELGYFFIAIALGLGMGAGQLLPTLIGFVILCIIVIVMSKRNASNSFSQNLLISLPCGTEEKSEIIKKVSAAVMEHANQVDVKRVKITQDEISINFLMNISSLDKINELNSALLKVNQDIDLTFIDSTV